jgi:Zn-dependent peptidase ImmA (M78 family)
MLNRDPDKDALQLLERVWTDRTLPVDPIRIARQLGVEVYVADLDPGWSGALMKQPFQDPEIYLSRWDSLNRQRFSCAHELGHYVLRSEEAGDDLAYSYVDKRDARASSGTEAEEVYANQFAAALLMPQDLVRSEHQRGGTAASLALMFGVSAEAMGFRLRNLRLA